MKLISFIQNQAFQIRNGNKSLVLKKIQRLLILPFTLLIYIFVYIISVPIVIIIRLIRPWLLIRFGYMISDRIGHFGANTELYLCEQDAGINVPERRYIDIFYLNSIVCNKQLLLMWKRLLHVWPKALIKPVRDINKCFPGWELHEIGQNTQADRDVHGLLGRFPSHLKLTGEEEDKGKAGLKRMGISENDRFVCLLVRDSAYLNDASWSYHKYRDSNIENYILAVEELAKRGYYVLRMGAKVNSSLASSDPKIIDYATNGMRNDFMDIYLGAKCNFCISTSSGWDAVPLIFRRPIAYVNMVPLGYLFTFLSKSIGITKKHYLPEENRFISLSEIFAMGVGFCNTAFKFEAKNIRLIENTPEEIRDLVTEFEERLIGKWISATGDEDLQEGFWKIFPIKSLSTNNGRSLHGEIRFRYGTLFLRKNPEWLI